MGFSPYQKLGSLVRCFDSKRIPLSSREREKIRGIFPYYGAAGIIDYVNKPIFSGLYLLLAEDGSVMNEDGTPVVQLVDGEFWVNNHTHVLQGQDDQDTKFLYYALKSLNISAFVTGAVQLKLNQENMNLLKVYFPDKQTRNQITDVLSALDNKIELNRRMNQTLEEVAKALFNQLFIVNPEREKWEQKALFEICSTQYGYTACAQSDNVGPRLLRITDMNKDPWIEWSHVPFCQISQREFQKYKLCVGDILVSRMADPGKAAIIESEVESVFASYLVRLKMNNPVNAYYIFYFLRSVKYLEYSDGAKSGSVQSGMNAKVITGVRLSIPPEKLVQSFNGQIQPLRQKIQANLCESSILSELRGTLLPKLMSGQVKVKNLR